MVVREDGSKWACTSCLKGHRVSGCNHTDRELHLVPKKGRPVTQCQHCRQERKKRSAHVSCDCAAPEKQHHTREKCIHLRDAEERVKHTGHADDFPHLDLKDPIHLATVAEEQGCCCLHGGKCTCALLRKESVDFDNIPQGPAVSKPKLEASRSDSSLTVFANGHHKPIHRKNHAAHESGMPYKPAVANRLPMARAKTDQNVSMASRRSVDSLAALDTQVNAQAFRPPSGSGNTSPKRMQAQLFANADGLTSDKYSLIDFSDLDRAHTNESVPSGITEANFAPYDMSSMLDSPFDDWPGLDPSLSTTAFPAWPVVEAGITQPALTAASSGTQSEIDEIPSIEDVYTHGMPSIQELNFDINNPLLMNSPQTNRRSLPPGFFGNIDFTSTFPNIEDEWQEQLGGQERIFGDKPASQTFVFNDPWQSTTLSSADRRTFIAPHATGRPVARSVGPGSAPSADIMKQLFPEMDVDLNANTTMQERARTQGVSHSISVSDEDEVYMAQSWNDGSMSVPVDTFDLQQAFDAQDFNARGWM